MSGSLRSDADLLSAAIRASGLSARAFALDVIARDDRTVRRWLAGDPLPAVLRVWLERYVTESRTAPARGRPR